MAIEFPYNDTEWGYKDHTGDNIETDFTVGFPYLNKRSAQNGSKPKTLFVYFDGVLQPTSGWSVQSAGNVIRFAVAPGSGVHIEFRRDSGIDDPAVQWTNNSPINQRSLQKDQDWAKFLDQELYTKTIALVDDLNAIIAAGPGLSGYVLFTDAGNEAVIADHAARTPNGDARGDSAVDLQTDRSGDAKVAAADNSTIGGGESNETVKAHGSITGGNQATTRRFGEQAYGGGSAADAQVVKNVATVRTSDATQTIMGYTSTNGTWASTTLDAATIPFPSSGAYMMAFEGYVIGMRAEAGGTDACCMKIEGAMKKDDAGNVAFVGSPKVSVVGRDDVNLDVDVVLAAANAGANIRVTGLAAEEWTWTCEWEGPEMLVPAL